MTTEADGYHPQNVLSSSTMASTTDAKPSTAYSLSCLGTMDRGVNREMNKTGEGPNDKAAISVRITEAYPKHIQARDTGTQLYGNNRIEQMLAEPTVCENPSVTSEPETEFDWKDYNFKNNHLTIDPGLVDSNSDMETLGKETWERPQANCDEQTKQVREETPEIYPYYPRDNSSQSSSNSQLSSGQFIRPEQIRGILKAKEESAADIIAPPNKTVSYGEPEFCVTKDPYDISESIEAFNQYLQRRASRFETDKPKKSKLKFLSQRLTIEKKTEFDRSSPGGHRHIKRYETNYSKFPLMNPTYTGSRTKQEFEKRNFTSTASKMVDVERLFLKNKQTPSECCSSSDEEYLEEEYVPSDVLEKRMSVPSLRVDSNRQRVIRALSLKGDETILLPLRRGSHFKKMVNKVRGMMNKNQFSMFEDAEIEDEKEIRSPLERFRHAGKLIIIMLRAIGIKPVKPEDSDYNFLSWTIMYDELGISRMNYDENKLTFDPDLFKAHRESFLSAEVRDILVTPPWLRSDSQIQNAIRFLSQVVPAFGEYPLRIQRSTLKCCTYERFEAGRVIIRQGHRAENFYFILSGSAVITIMESGVNHVHTVNVLSCGSSFGELAFLNMSQRTATVTCRENMELLCIERDDFVQIFMRKVKDKDPEHVSFLRSVDVLKGWPIEKLPVDNLKICAFTYVRRGVTLCPDSSRSDWLFVVVSGTCKILKALNDVNLSSEKSPRSPIHASRHCMFPRVEAPDSNSGMTATEQRALHRKSKGSRHTNLPNRSHSGITTVMNRSEEEVRQSRSEHATQLENIFHKRHVLPSIIQRQKRRQLQAAQAGDQHKYKIENNKKGNTSKDKKREDKENNIYYNRNLDEEEEEDDSTSKSTITDGILTPPVADATPSQFLRPATQNFGIHRSSLKQTEDALAPIEAARKAWQKKKLVKPKVFIEVARLEHGDIFGLEQVVMSDMDDVTATSLVSDGAEVIIIEKKFFRKHLTEETAKRIRQTIRPLPSDRVLQQNLVDQRHWDAYKLKTLETQARHLVQTKLLNHAFGV